MLEACLAGKALDVRYVVTGSVKRDGERMLDAPTRRTSSLEEKFELIASGHGIALVPQSVARSYSRPDLVHLPVTDAPEVETCLAVAVDRREKLLRDFLEIATTTLRHT